MSKRNKISRRNFLITVLAASGVSFFAGSFWYSEKVEDAVASLNDLLNDESLNEIITGIEDSAKTIGKEYIGSYSIEYSKSEFISEINTELADQDLTSDMFFDIKERIKKKILADFDNMRFIELKNWLITKTEAQICAIIYLSN